MKKFFIAISRHFFPIGNLPIRKKSYLLLIVLAICSLSCKRKEPPCDIDPDVHDSVQAENIWMLRYKVGDTLRMNMYRINRDSGRRYEFIQEVQYVAADSSIEESIVRRADVPNCEHGIYGYPVYVYFDGPKNLKVGVAPQGSFDWLHIIFDEKKFELGDLQYNYPGHRYFSTLWIGGKEYNDVNLLYAEGLDSTNAFYNYDYGILKFIINDTLAYIRKP